MDCQINQYTTDGYKDVTADVKRETIRRELQARKNESEAILGRHSHGQAHRWGEPPQDPKHKPYSRQPQESLGRLSERFESSHESFSSVL